MHVYHVTCSWDTPLFSINSVLDVQISHNCLNSTYHHSYVWGPNANVHNFCINFSLNKWLGSCKCFLGENAPYSFTPFIWHEGG